MKGCLGLHKAEEGLSNIVGYVKGRCKRHPSKAYSRANHGPDGHLQGCAGVVTEQGSAMLISCHNTRNEVSIIPADRCEPACYCAEIGSSDFR